MTNGGTRRLKVVLAQPRGFCAGVGRAVEIVEHALALHGDPVFVRHEIVHNKRVVDSLRKQGARFVEELDEIPDGAVTIFSAHGVSEQVERTAAARSLPVIDATCPLVSKVHRAGRAYADKGLSVVLIGHAGHPEVEGTRGRIPGTVHLVSSVDAVMVLDLPDPNKVAYVTQTTLSLDDTRDIIRALQQRFPAIEGPDVKNICYATQNRQTAARSLAAKVDLFIVLGARNSSNSNRLREIGVELDKPSYLIDDALGFDPAWLDGVSSVGITAGASAPEELVQELLTRLRQLAEIDLEILDGIVENVEFQLPPELTGSAS
ncbi:MAG: 4-hydroxy-3-methylbut-2-enyl diphosphate reductase [Alphaproteobacteria bacterium]|nr:4-hydroxy-3-methylbut-2-enyl diphosphate reductase [Alphaproteobacteria bacterium]MBF0128523.1 4-hydroxy-3-methylbut-2-enyl diphosphate reductase [Alphaproteobacteria bacterium]